MEQTEKKTFPEKFEKFHDRYYKHLLLIPLILILLSFSYMFFFYQANNDFLYKDISLTGGTSVTIQGNLDSVELRNALSGKLDEINTREIYDISTRQKEAVIIETKSNSDETKKILEEYLGYELTNENSSFEFTQSGISESFYKQLIYALLYAFLFMAIIVFLVFRKFIPCVAIIISAFANIFMTLVLINLIGIKMSSAGIVAFLMLIGYSVDTDILLTNKLLKNNEGTINQRLFRAFKTGMTMTLTSIIAVGFALVVVSSFSVILTQIFTVLLIGLGFDLLNTWITNVSLLKWYAKKND